MMDIGKQIKEQREINNWTQQELADKIGVSRTTIVKYEKGTREPDAKTLVALANIFDISLDELMCRQY